MALLKPKETATVTKQYQRIKAKVKPHYLEKDSAFRDCTAGKVYTGAVLLNDELEVDELGKEATIKDDRGDYVCCTTRELEVLEYFGKIFNSLDDYLDEEEAV
ncbi:hypothetical protein [Escherichia coli]|uniref:hypothetical protein n=1 Tax=Escherichia coli TaxID=562 RepID=UPI0013002CDF|nr:hypothetical protein [Escherichia coli]